MLLSQKRLRQILGILWLIDGLLQLQTQMFTMNMANSVMEPMLQGQPGLIEPSLKFIVNIQFCTSSESATGVLAQDPSFGA